jgi:dTDP-4-dehydrorhamnose 3,5-epimerase-like enzyme
MRSLVGEKGRTGVGVDVRSIDILVLGNSGDARGSSYPVPASWFDPPFPVQDAHISMLLPRRVRGDHYHVKRSEILIVFPGPRWSLFFDNGPDSVPLHRHFDGRDAVVISVPPLISHAIRNDGESLLHLVGLTDGPYDPASPDAFTRMVTPL